MPSGSQSLPELTLAQLRRNCGAAAPSPQGFPRTLDGGLHTPAICRTDKMTMSADAPAELDDVAAQVGRSDPALFVASQTPECVLTVEVSGTHTDSHRPIMLLDLSSLRDALAALNVSLRHLDSDSAADPGLRDQFRAAAIQAFEFTYELAFKFMKRQLAQIMPVPSAVDEMTFMQVVRAAAEAGLVADVSRFHEYREARNITSHSGRRKAQRIVAELPRFAEDVGYLLSRLEARNRADD